MTSTQYTSHEIASIISSQFENQVALFNLKDKNAFFFLSPEEARIAMDYIKQWRISGFKQISREKKLDEFVKSFRNNYDDQKLDTIVINNKFEQKEFFSLDFLNYSYSAIETENRIVDAIIVNAITFAEIRNWGRCVYEEPTKQECVEREIGGRIFNADIYLCDKIEDYQLVLLSMPDEKHKDVMIKKTIYVHDNYLKQCLNAKISQRERVLKGIENYSNPE